MIVVNINNYESGQAADIAAADIEYDLRAAGWDVTVTLEGRPATPTEESDWRNGYVSGEEYIETEHGLMVLDPYV